MRAILPALLFSTSAALAAPCDSGVAHVPDAGVAYQPGVDTQGWAVEPVEADPPAKMDITIPLETPLKDHIKADVYNAELGDTAIPIGEMRVHDGGAEVSTGAAGCE